MNEQRIEEIAWELCSQYGFQWKTLGGRGQARFRRDAKRIAQLFEPKFDNALQADAHNWDTRELEPKVDEDRLLNINEWLDALGIDRAYKKDMKPTFDQQKLSRVAQDRKTAHILDCQWNQKVGEVGVEGYEAGKAFTALADKPKTDEDGLLTDEGVYIDMAIKAKEDHLAVLLQAQRDLTAVAKDEWWKDALREFALLWGVTSNLTVQKLLDALENQFELWTTRPVNKLDKDAEHQAKLKQVFAEIEGFGQLEDFVELEDWHALKEKWLKEGR